MISPRWLSDYVSAFGGTQSPQGFESHTIRNSFSVRFLKLAVKGPYQYRGKSKLVLRVRELIKVSLATQSPSRHFKNKYIYVTKLKNQFMDLYDL